MLTRGKPWRTVGFNATHSTQSEKEKENQPMEKEAALAAWKSICAAVSETHDPLELENPSSEGERIDVLSAFRKRYGLTRPS